VSNLISTANLAKITDKLAYVYERMAANGGSAAFGSYVVGTNQYLLNQALSNVVGIGDYIMETDLGAGFYSGLNQSDRKSIATRTMGQALQAINQHLSLRGSAVDPTVRDLASYLNYYNGGNGGAAFSAMLHPQFGQLYADVAGAALPAAGLFQPSLHPLLSSATNGIGKRAVGGSLTTGTAPDTTNYSAPLINAQVAVDFASGTGAPTVTVAGTDNTGATSTTWLGVFTGNNPAAAVSTTITPAITAMTRATVAVASAAGIVPGSVLTVNAGLIDQEIITVEAVSGSNVTAVFDKAHGAGAALTGNTTIQLAPSVSGRRLKTMSGITIGITGHTAGTVLVYGVLERQHDPS
jgi:hypothetical protein